MRHRIFRLAILAALSFVVPVAAPAVRVIPLPRPLAAAPASTVPDRLLTRRAELALTQVQAKLLAAPREAAS
jgi:hypothetical protein